MRTPWLGWAGGWRLAAGRRLGRRPKLPSPPSINHPITPTPLTPPRPAPLCPSPSPPEHKRNPPIMSNPSPPRSMASSRKTSPPTPNAAPFSPNPQPKPPASNTAVSYALWHNTVTTTSASSIQVVRTGAIDATPAQLMEFLSSSPESLLPPPSKGAVGALAGIVVHDADKRVFLAFRTCSVKGSR